EIFYSLAEAKIIIEAWRRYRNTERPHSSLGYKPPAPEAIIWTPRSTGISATGMQHWRREGPDVRRRLLYQASGWCGVAVFAVAAALSTALAVMRAQFAPGARHSC